MLYGLRRRLVIEQFIADMSIVPLGEVHLIVSEREATLDRPTGTTSSA